MGLYSGLGLAAGSMVIWDEATPMERSTYAARPHGYLIKNPWSDRERIGKGQRKANRHNRWRGPQGALR